MMIRIFILLLFAAYAHPASAANLFVYSASSMAAALEEITKDYPHDRIRIVSAATPALVWQIQHGARADIFISAHPIWIKKVKSLETALIGYNSLVLAARRTHPFVFKLDQSGVDLKKALAGDRFAISNVATPAGFYTRQALTHHKLWSSVNKIAILGTNARATLSWLVHGDAAAAIIYGSDLHTHPSLRAVAQFERESHQPIIYHMARLSSSDAVQELWTFLRSNAARDKLEKWGFDIKK